MTALPDDLNAVKRLAVDLSFQVDVLVEELRLTQAQLYGRHSEKLRYKNDPQLLLFEPERVSPEPDDEAEDVSAVRAYRRGKPVRKTLPANLPRMDIVYDIPEVDKLCACGCMKRSFGFEVSEQLDIIPQILRVLRHLRPKFSCPRCEGTAEPDKPTFAIAPLPLQIIAKSIASPGLLAHIITAKFVDAVPLYRQQAQFARMGVNISRGTMCSWVIKVGDACAKLVEFLFQEAKTGQLVHCDETRLQVLKEDGRDPTTDSYAWVIVGGTSEHPVIAFTYDPTRSGRVAQGILEGYQGHVMTDAYAGYNFLEDMLDIVHHACWAHARRGFTDVIKAAHEKIGKSNSLAQQAVRWIRKLYSIERRADEANFTIDQRATIRQEQSKPILASLKAWLLAIQPQVPPKTLLGKAIAYTLNEWVRLVAYADTGFVPIDNNRVENAIRPFVVGRKNWMFSDTPEGAHASMRIFSLVETAKANGIDPYWYLRHLFEKLPLAKTDEEIRALLPMHIDRTLVQPYSVPARKTGRSKGTEPPAAAR